MEALQQLLSQTKVNKDESIGNNTNLVVSLAKQGNTSHSLLSQRFSINFGSQTVEHQITTCSLKILSNYKFCDQGIIVFMAGGTTSLAHGRGTTCMASLTLKSILYVLNLRCNLLSVSKITKERDCSITFLILTVFFKTYPREK